MKQDPDQRKDVGQPVPGRPRKVLSAKGSVIPGKNLSRETTRESFARPQVFLITGTQRDNLLHGPCLAGEPFQTLEDFLISITGTDDGRGNQRETSWGGAESRDRSCWVRSGTALRSLTRPPIT